MSRAAKMPLKSIGGINTLPTSIQGLRDEKIPDFRPETPQKNEGYSLRPVTSRKRGRRRCAIPRMSKKRKMEWAFFLNERNRITYNKLCLKCQGECKQSFRALVIQCPKFKRKEKKTNGRT